MTASRLGIIAGGGDLPWKLADHAKSSGRDVFILALTGFADPGLQQQFGGAEAAMGEIGKGIRLLKQAGCTEVVFAGTIKRPDLSTLKFDLKGASLLPDLIAAGTGGDALLRVVLNAFEKAGFKVVGADDVLGALLAPAGPLGSRLPTKADWADIRAAAAAATKVGAVDVGQGALARGGVVIAMETEEGTDAMLRRIAKSKTGSGGVLVKRPKPQQERRIDLPTIGTQTALGAHAAGLSGIAVEAGAALVMNRTELAQEADRLGLFVYGLHAGGNLVSHVFLVAAEDSGDAMGADVIDALRARDPAIRISGIGGKQMRERGAFSDVDMSGLAVVGLFEGLKAYGRVKKAVADAAESVAKADPDAVVLIDSWGFMWRLAQALKKRGSRARRIKLIGPQVWATRPGRARVLAQWCDHLLCIHDFEQPFYKRWGLPTTVIGNPALSRMPKGDGAAFRKTHGIATSTRLIGLLPGSRPAEIRRVMPTLVAAAEKLCGGYPERQVICVMAGSIEAAVREATKDWKFPHILVSGDGDKADAFAAMEVALASSGTVTTELGAQGAAVVAGYQLGWMTWAILRAFLFRSPYTTLMNVAAGKEIVPEFTQTTFTVDNIARAAERLLSDSVALEEQRRGQREALAKMAGPGRPAAEIAAETILKLA